MIGSYVTEYVNAGSRLARRHRLEKGPKMGELILVIDDDAAVRNVVKRVLESEGYTVQVGENGLQGLELLKKITPRLVITDLIMPGKEGVELIVEIRKSYDDLKIIAISGGGRIGNMDFLAVARRLGADDVLAKPFDPDDLVALVQKHLDNA